MPVRLPSCLRDISRAAAIVRAVGAGLPFTLGKGLERRQNHCYRQDRRMLTSPPHLHRPCNASLSTARAMAVVVLVVPCGQGRQG